MKGRQFKNGRAVWGVQPTLVSRFCSQMCVSLPPPASVPGYKEEDGSHAAPPGIGLARCVGFQLLLLACSERAEAPLGVRMNVSWGALPPLTGRWPQRSGPLWLRSQATQLGISGHARPVFRNLQLNESRSGPLPSTLLPYCFFVIVFIALKKKPYKNNSCGLFSSVRIEHKQTQGQVHTGTPTITMETALQPCCA